MRRFLLIVISTLFLALCTFSQAPPSWTSAEMYQAIRKLSVLGSVLYVAAHPDDENTRLISYLSKDRLYRTGYLSLTRGDGGQNLIGDEQGIELGLIRTQELLAARRVDGGEQFFTRAYDFGYSKNPEETFIKWDKEKILSDVVWVIRKFQPDVIITRFPTTGEGGHGHHTASAILANEAFTAAADPNRFPEQLKYVIVWQAKRILWNTFNFGGTNTQSSDQFKIDVGGYNPLLGKSYGEISAASRSQHKSQGFGVPASRGEALEYFRTLGGNAPVNDLMDGVDITWKKVSGADAIEKMVNDLAAAFDFLNPEKSVKGLVELYRKLNAMPQSYWRNKKLDETKQLIEQCSGLWLDVFTQDQFAVRTDSVRFNFQFNNRLGVSATLKKISTDGFDSTMNQILAKNRNVNFAKTFLILPSKSLTQPYWLENRMEQGYFNVNDQQKIGQADVDPAYTVRYIINIEGEDISYVRHVKYKFTDPVKGELYQPLAILAEFEVQQKDEVVKPNDKNEILVNYTVRSNIKNSGGEMWTHIFPSGYNYFYKDTINNFTKNQVIEFSKTDNKLFKAWQTGQSHLRFAIDDFNKNTHDLSIEFPNKEGHSIFPSYVRTIKYDHIPSITYFKIPSFHILPNDIKTYNKKIAYIAGAGDKVPEALEQMGYEVNMLTEKELSRNSLDKFDAIITGVRAYNTNEWLNKYYDKLMKYVNDGGNLIVQYNTSSNLGPVRAKIGPYHFNITRTRVTDENAKVILLKPEHPVFNFPNKITDEDFKGWIQERSIYHGSDTTGKFEKLIGMSDPGEKSDDGSLLAAKYGKGWFTYTGLVFFRELPAGVPGAYRLLANIIALNKKKGF